MRGGGIRTPLSVAMSPAQPLFFYVLADWRVCAPGRRRMGPNKRDPTSVSMAELSCNDGNCGVICRSQTHQETTRLAPASLLYVGLFSRVSVPC